MLMAETITDFMKRFVTGEYELNVIFLSEPDDEILKTKRKEVLEFFLPGTSDALMNQFNMLERSDEWLEKNKESIKYLKPRTVFQIEGLDCPGVGKIYRCLLGQNSTQYKSHSPNICKLYHFGFLGQRKKSH